MVEIFAGLFHRHQFPTQIKKGAGLNGIWMTSGTIPPARGEKI